MSAKTTHGHYIGGASPTYVTWQNMRTRCLNSSDPTYPRYGGVGITVCKRWARFENFLADMGERPAGMTLDRRNGSKGYSKSNCRWATKQEQARNRCTSIIVDHDGDAVCVAELARARSLVDTSTVYRRLRAGWSIEGATTKPAHPSLSAFGKTQSISAWARDIGVSRGTIRARIQRGCSPEQALQNPTGA